MSGSPPRAPGSDDAVAGPRPIAAVAAEVLRSGRCAVLSGPAGIGKSRALRQTADLLRAAGTPVRALRATASLAAVPLGALLPLLAEADRTGHRTGTALAVLSLLRGARGTVVLVDDAHLLDAASAGLLHQAALNGLPVGVAVRDGEGLPDAVARLVPDLGAIELEVPRLREQDTAALVLGLLGGTVDDGLVRVLHGRSGGLPLAVQALARSARDTGAIAPFRGEWRLRGTIPVSDELASLMRGAVAVLDDPGRRAAELVALAERLTEEELVALAAVDGAEAAERHGVLTVSRSGASVLAHPLLLDALLAGLPVLRRRRRLTELVDAIDGGASTVERLRSVEWRLELGRPVGVAELLESTDLTAPDDPERAERYARAAVAALGGAPARLRLAEVLAHLHRAGDAEAVLAEIDPATLDAASVTAVELTRAFLLVFALARPDEALVVLDPLPVVPMVVALGASAHLYAGRLDQAVQQAEAVAEDGTAPADARAHAALTLVTATLLSGDHEGFGARLPRARSLVGAAIAAIPEGRESLRLLEGVDAVRVHLDPAGAERLAAAGYRDALARGEDGERAQWAEQLGEIALLRGDPVEAVDLLRRAARNRGRWATATTGWIRGALVRALALAGEQEEAVRELAELHALRVVPIMRVDVALAEAEVSAGDRDLRAAARIAEDAARALRVGRPDAWYAALRFGRPGAAAAFLAASASCTGRGRAAQRVHARALLARDGAELEAASGALADAGLGWFAVDAMVHAVQAFARTDPGDGGPGERLRRLTAEHPSLRSPLVTSLDGPVLTEREAEVARLVAEGASARAIAERLGVGVRTVESHIGHAYRKLGVRSRDELRAAIGGR